MNIFYRLLQGLGASVKGMMSVAGFGILALALPLLMLKMKGNEGREIARSVPKLKATQASISESPIIPDVMVRELEPKLILEDPHTFSFGNSIEQDRRPVLNRSTDPNEIQ